MFTKTVGAAGRNPQAVHWNGSSWTIVPTPTLTGGAKSTLNGVVALSANNAWAVGKGRNGAALVEHWYGSAWSVVASPNVSGNDNLLNGVSASAGDVWAVGSSDVFAHTLALRETG